jgi:tryptophan halogenase
MTVRRVAVVGSGIAPAMAAIALRRAFARGGVAVDWVETPDTISPHATLAALPNVQAFHRLLGIGEAELLRAARGTFALARQYLGFTPGGDWLHSYGPVGRPFAAQPFAQYWIKARAGGLPARFEDFGREAVAARNGLIRLGDSAAGAPLAYGYHLDARGYAALLREQAERAGVTIIADPGPSAVTGDGRVKALRLADGRTIEADLFVDALGEVRAALGEDETADAAVTGCDRVMLASAPALRPAPLHSRVTAHKAGWTVLHPLQDRTGICVAYDSRTVGDDEAVVLAGAPLTGEPHFVPLRPFRRVRPWAGNVVAIGDAAGAVEPLGGVELHRLQVALTHLVSLFPVDAAVMPEAEIYNEELAGYHARLQDFDAAQAGLNGRDEPFWQAERARPRSAELDARISLFGARGMIAQYNQDSFAPDEWQACLLGNGIVPRSWDPQVDRVDEQSVMEDFRAQLMAIRADVSAMESHEAALARAMRA